MLNKILSFFNSNDFYPKTISWRKLVSMNENVTILYIKDSISKQGINYLKIVRKKFTQAKIKAPILYFTNSKIASQWFIANSFLNTKIIIIGINYDCAYLYRLIKSKGIQVWLLKN